MVLGYPFGLGAMFSIPDFRSTGRRRKAQGLKMQLSGQGSIVVHQ
jgi:hypothetical protein